MADAQVIIRAHLRGERELRKAKREIAEIGAAAALTDKRLKSMGGSSNTVSNQLKNSSNRFKKHFDGLDKMVQFTGKSFIKMFSMMSKAVVLEMGVMGAAMVAFHGLLVTGRALVKAYHGAMQVLAGGAAAATVALASAAAAIREQQAAMFAYKGANYGFKELGNNTRMVSAVMRSLTRDTDLASAGVENLNAAFAAVSQRSTFTEGSRTLLKGLMDFASAGQPLEQGVKAAGELIGILQDPSANFSEIKTAAEALGPAMKEAMKKAGIDTAEELKAAISSGQLAVSGGVSGQFAAVNDTLISRFKKNFTIIREEFADLGDMFLGPLKGSLEEIARNFRVTFIRIRGEILRFGQGAFQDGLVGGLQKMNDLMVHLVREYLPKVEGMFDRIGEWWNKVSVGWDYMVSGMKKFVPAAKVVEKVFTSFAGPVWDSIKGAFTDFGNLLVENEESFTEFGTKLGEVLAEFFKFGQELKKVFVEALPFINDILTGVKQVISFTTDAFKMLRGIIGGTGTNGFGAFLTLAAALVGFNKMKNTKGGFINAPQKVGSMQVQAGSVQITGMTTGGQMMQGAAPPTLVSGPGATGGGFASKGMAQQVRAMKAANPGMTSAQAMAAIKSGGGYATGAGGQFIGQGRGAFSLYRNLRNVQGMSRMQALGMLSSQPITYAPGPRGLGMLGVGARNARASALGQATSRFAGSMSGRIGTGIGMNLAAGFMPEEAQGAMALGSAVSMINPFAGLAVGLGGTAMNSRTAAGGALSGAGAGAAIGTMIAPGIGTAIGAVVGAVGGAIMGTFGKAKHEKKMAREAAKGFAEEMISNTFEGIRDTLVQEGITAFTTSRLGELTGLDELGRFRSVARTTLETDASKESMQQIVRNMYDQAELLGMEMPDTLENALKKPEEFLKQFIDSTDVQYAAANEIQTKYTSRMEELTRRFGMTEEQILELSQSVNVDLFDATANFDDMVKKLADGLISTAAEMNQAFADLLGQEMDVLGVARAAAEAPKIIDESARVMREKILGGGVTDADMFTFFEEQLGGLIDFFGGDEFAAIEAFNRLYVDGAAFTQAGGQLEGLAMPFQSSQAVSAYLSGAGGRYREALATTPGNMLTNALASRSLELADPSVLSGMTAERATQLRTLVGREDFATMGADQIAQALADIGLNTAIKDMQHPLETMATSQEELTAVAENLNITLADLRTAMENLSTAISNMGDTSAPMYSNLQQTMAKHKQIDSTIGGNRVITSSYRNFALGSMNSDHLSGRAIDLVGSNLGSYANAMNASGGFAEFHGQGKARHLHAVPGPMGDSTSSAKGNNTYNYSINVAGGPNADAQEVASLVMSEIRRIEQSRRERS